MGSCKRLLVCEDENYVALYKDAACPKNNAYYLLDNCAFSVSNHLDTLIHRITIGRFYVNDKFKGRLFRTSSFFYT
jgi:hypothetical protein